MKHKTKKHEASFAKQEASAVAHLTLHASRFTLHAAMPLILLCLCGCGPGSVADLRNRAHSTYSIEVPADYATVYDRIALRARQRYVSVSHPTHQPGVSARISQEHQAANVTLWDSGRIGLRFRITADIRPIDSDHTQIDVYAAARDDSQEAPLWALWATTPLEE